MTRTLFLFFTTLVWLSNASTITDIFNGCGWSKLDTIFGGEPTCGGVCHKPGLECRIHMQFDSAGETLPDMGCSCLRKRADRPKEIKFRYRPVDPGATNGPAQENDCHFDHVVEDGGTGGDDWGDNVNGRYPPWLQHNWETRRLEAAGSKTSSIELVGFSNERLNGVYTEMHDIVNGFVAFQNQNLILAKGHNGDWWFDDDLKDFELDHMPHNGVLGYIDGNLFNNIEGTVLMHECHWRCSPRQIQVYPIGRHYVLEGFISQPRFNGKYKLRGDLVNNDISFANEGHYLARGHNNYWWFDDDLYDYEYDYWHPDGVFAYADPSTNLNVLSGFQAYEWEEDIREWVRADINVWRTDCINGVEFVEYPLGECLNPTATNVIKQINSYRDCAVACAQDSSCQVVYFNSKAPCGRKCEHATTKCEGTTTSYYWMRMKNGSC